MDILQTISPVFPRAIPTLPATLVDNYWADFLGCDLDQLLSDGTSHQLTSTKHQSIWAFARRSSWVVIVPTSWPQAVREQLYHCFQPNLVPDAVQLQRLLDQTDHQQLYGPALIMLYARDRYRQSKRPAQPLPDVRPLTATDQEQALAFQVAAKPIVWSLQEPTIWPKIFGVFVEDQLVAACGIRVWGELLAELYVDTLPTHWRRGYGKIATEAALQWIHTASPYQAESVVELANAASWRLMHNASFTPYAYMVTSFMPG